MAAIKRLNRRKVVLGLAGLGVAGVVYRYWPEDGLVNPCPLEPIPDSILQHELVQAAWEGIDPTRFWDSHVHLVGTGDSGSGLWVNPKMRSLKNPFQWLQLAFYFNASCTADDGPFRPELRRTPVLAFGSNARWREIDAAGVRLFS